jgi:hypothetical protein
MRDGFAALFLGNLNLTASNYWTGKRRPEEINTLKSTMT